MEELKLIDYTKKKLDSLYLVIYGIKNNLNVKKGESIENISIYTLVGVDKSGIRQLLGIYQDKPLNNRYWLDVFESLKSRGISTVLFVSIDDNKNFKRCIKISLPMVIFVDSMTTIVSKLYEYIPERDSRILSNKIFELFSQPTLEDFKRVQSEFKKTYNNMLYQKLMEKYLKNVEGYYKYSKNVRNLLFKPVANMKMYDKIRISFNNRGSYVNDINDAYEKLDSMDKFFGIKAFRKKEFGPILNDLMQMYPEMEFI